MKQNKKSSKRESLKTYLCIEDNERFTIEAKNLKEAEEGAAMFNGSVIKELKQGETA